MRQQIGFWCTFSSAILIGLFLLLVVAKGNAAKSPISTAARQAVSGTIVFDVDARNSVPVPDFKVELRKDGQGIGSAVTDGNGIFTFANVPNGKYRICWSDAGWFTGCSGEVLVKGAAAYGGTLAVEPIGHAVHGSVTLADGENAAYIDPFFGVFSRPTVSVTGTPLAVRTNSAGHFVFPNVPPAARQLVATIGAAVATAPISPDATIRIANQRPRFASAERSIAPRRAIKARVGETITIDATATDPDGNALTYSWQAPAGTKVAHSGAKLQYKPPSKPGVYSVSALASDGRGGFSQIAFDVRVAGTGVSTTAATPPGLVCNSIVDFYSTTCGADTPKGCDRSQFLNFYTTPTRGELAICQAAGTKLDVCGQNSAEAYYNAVDPQKKRQTLSDFFAVAGFNPDGSGGQNVAYMNDNDLGFGRDMHFIQTPAVPGGFIFSYVTNYLNNPTDPNTCVVQDPQNAQLAADRKATNVTATVVMEYAPLDWIGPGTNPVSIQGEKPFVKFFAYDPAGNLLKAAALDPYGPKFLPNLCLNCHGGVQPGWDTSSGQNSANLSASFLPFDLDTYKYPSSGIDYAGFKDLNVNYVINANPAPAIVELIQGWYASGGNTPDNHFVPVGWKNNGAAPLDNDDLSKMYYYVVARGCRTCHVSFTAKPTWNTWTDANSTGFAQKGSLISFFALNQGTMPHAFVAYNNTWTQNFWPDNYTPTTFRCFTTNFRNPTNLHTCLQSVPKP